MRVVFLTAILTHYRVPFHEAVRRQLAEQDIEYQLAFGQPTAREAKKNDTATLNWATPVKNVYVNILGIGVVWQSAVGMLNSADLVVIGQENRLLLNYLLQITPSRLRPKLALWGHGRNYQAAQGDSVRERWKRLWATRCDWWFGYTEATKKDVANLGFPEERITVVNNAVDTSKIRDLVANVSQDEREVWRQTLGLSGGNVCVFVGGLYPEKRLAFLVQAGQLIRELVPDFELVVVGGGPDSTVLGELAAGRGWLKITGPRFDAEKAQLMSLGKLFLMPGLVGLAILDAGVAGLPIVTTNFPHHSPEIAYLREFSNGLIVRPWDDVGCYAREVAALLQDPERMDRMSLESRRIAQEYTIDTMAKRFVDGVQLALASPPRRS